MVGAGGIVRKMYLPLLSSWPGIEVVGLTSRRRESYEPLARAFRLPAVADVDAGLRLKPDVVFIHSSTDTHSELVVKAMKAGMAVFVDKPLAYHLQEAERVIEVAASTGRALLVGFNRRFAPFYVKAKAAIAQPGLIVVEKHRRDQWFGDPRESLFDDFIHPLDTLLGLSGSIAHAEMIVREGQTLIQADAGPGRMALMHRGIAYEGERLSIAGVEGRIEVEDLEHYRHLRLGQTTQENFLSWQSIAWRRGFQTMIETVEQVIQGHGRWPISLDDLFLSHRVVESLAETGRFHA